MRIEFDHRLTADTCRRLMLGRDPWQRLGLGIDDIDRFAALAADGEAIAAYADDVVVGIAITGGAMLLGGYLRLLAVDDGFQRRGVGRALVRAFEQRAFSRWPNAYLCVSDFNGGARAFYRSLGYVEIGVLPDLLVCGHAEVLMRKSTGPWRRSTPAVRPEMPRH